MKNYRYEILGAHYNYGIETHPHEQMIKLGFHVIKGEPVPIADCWIFRVDNENEIENIPGYLKEINDDFKFAGEE